MAYSWWDAVKDFLGASGSLFIAMPWLKDFSLRRQKSRVGDIAAAGQLGRLKASIENSIRQKIDSPKMADFIWTMLGLVSIFASFLIAFIRGLSDLL